MGQFGGGRRPFRGCSRRIRRSATGSSLTRERGYDERVHRRDRHQRCGPERRRGIDPNSLKSGGSCFSATRSCCLSRCRLPRHSASFEQRLNQRSPSLRYRVVNAGVQGYGPVEEQLFFRAIASTVQPDLVLPVVFVGNDAEEAEGSRQARRDPTHDRDRRRVLSDAIAASHAAAWSCRFSGCDWLQPTEGSRRRWLRPNRLFRAMRQIPRRASLMGWRPPVNQLKTSSKPPPPAQRRPSS